MLVGVHLPQYGHVAGPQAITQAARHAESLGFADIWVSDHVVHPAAQSYPSPHLYDALVTLTWGAAVTSRVGLGTSVLVVPMHNPLELANSLASIDALSQGRLVAGVGVGWSEPEYDALGYGFHDRGRRLDEILDLWRVAWRDDPVSFHGEFVSFDDIRCFPKPARPIPIWVGGGSEAA
ncbi:MAG TPA: TIGR03619 family F420-dependent LLM class oxidoreductase, partial [Acidimicrobiales bacterium]|nr:TIGR03619 family F420-dependent LLM class oxidoreductase [Acidimicrobiales bacterium]